jgi:hypothetical protein
MALGRPARHATVGKLQQTRYSHSDGENVHHRDDELEEATWSIKDPTVGTAGKPLASPSGGSRKSHCTSTSYSSSKQEDTHGKSWPSFPVPLWSTISTQADFIPDQIFCNSHFSSKHRNTNCAALQAGLKAHLKGQASSGAAAVRINAIDPGLAEHLLLCTDNTADIVMPRLIT